MPAHNGSFFSVFIPKARLQKISFHFIMGSIIPMVPHKRSFLSDLLSIFFVEKSSFLSLCQQSLKRYWYHRLERPSLNEIWLTNTSVYPVSSQHWDVLMISDIFTTALLHSLSENNGSQGRAGLDVERSHDNNRNQGRVGLDVHRSHESDRSKSRAELDVDGSHDSDRSQDRAWHG